MPVLPESDLGMRTGLSVRVGVSEPAAGSTVNLTTIRAAPFAGALLRNNRWNQACLPVFGSLFGMRRPSISIACVVGVNSMVNFVVRRIAPPLCPSGEGTALSIPKSAWTFPFGNRTGFTVSRTVLSPRFDCISMREISVLLPGWSDRTARGLLFGATLVSAT